MYWHVQYRSILLIFWCRCVHASCFVACCIRIKTQSSRRWLTSFRGTIWAFCSRFVSHRSEGLNPSGLQTHILSGPGFWNQSGLGRVDGLLSPNVQAKTGRSRRFMLWTSSHSGMRIFATCCRCSEHCRLWLTACTTERAFSAMKQLKMCSRNSVIDERLTGFASTHLHHPETVIKLEKVIDRRSPISEAG